MEGPRPPPPLPPPASYGGQALAAGSHGWEESVETDGGPAEVLCPALDGLSLRVLIGQSPGTEPIR